jgi:cell division cycle 20-like protein 1 (cofactor of APC complex)
LEIKLKKLKFYHLNLINKSTFVDLLLLLIQMSRNTFSISNLDNSCYNNRNNTDRFIPSRDEIDIEVKKLFSLRTLRENSMAELEVEPTEKIEGSINDENTFYKDLLFKNLKKTNIVSNSYNNIDIYENSKNYFDVPKMKKLLNLRKIDTVPFKILDAPLLQDDYYLNVVDWSVTNNLAVGLANTCYVWNFDSNEVHKILELEEENFVSCLSWDQKGHNLVTANFEGNVRIFDFNKKKEILKYDDHMERVGALSLFNNYLITGSRDSMIYFYDIRCKEKPLKCYTTHKQEVCGLKWSPNGNYFASGGNDNKLNVFSLKTDIPLYRKSHKAAVKALCWSERLSNILATGAGTADRSLRIFNMDKKKVIQARDTGSQICNLQFSKREDEIISAHGFSKNEVIVWKVKNLQKVCTFSGHSCRVLYLGISPDGNSIVTGAGDETLRFWGLNYQEKKNFVKSFNDLNIINPVGLR